MKIGKTEKVHRNIPEPVPAEKVTPKAPTKEPVPERELVPVRIKRKQNG